MAMMRQKRERPERQLCGKASIFFGFSLWTICSQRERKEGGGVLFAELTFPPSMYEMEDLTAAVLVYPGSYVLIPRGFKSLALKVLPSLTFILCSFPVDSSLMTRCLARAPALRLAACLIFTPSALLPIPCSLVSPMPYRALAMR